MIRQFLNTKHYIALEFAILCLLLPGYIIYTKSAAFMFSFLWGACLYSIIIHRICQFKGHADLWRFDAVTRKNLTIIVMRWIPACIGMTAFLYFYDPARLFYLPASRPEFIPFLIVGYTFISALPQEFIFCSFFFARYACFFGTGQRMVLASAIIFAYAHVLYINPIAPSFGFIGGLIFAFTYLRTKSLALVTIEHGLYGSALFIIGLGWYFYSGSVSAG